MKTFYTIIFLLTSFLSFAKENPGIKSKKTDILEKAAVNCTPPLSMADLDINNVRATILAGGDMWWDLSTAGYEVPIGSNKHSLFGGAFWIGGFDAGGQIHLAAQTYRQTGSDYWAGAIDTTTVDITAARCMFYDNHYIITRQEVDDFVSNGTLTPAITGWPGNGDASFNEGHFLAPFNDANGDGIYDPNDGDSPGYNLSGSFPTVPGTPVPDCENYLFGEKTIWWVINDVGNVHTSSGASSIGLEIRCQAFAYSSAVDAINNATFYKFQMINRSSSTYNDTYFGQWVDPDLGNAVDDYVGCDVMRGLGYCYNGDSNDDTGAGYGIDPPAVGVDFLRGPDADDLDGVDNDLDGCLDCTYFDSAGTTIVIPTSVMPERIGMSKFIYYHNMNNSPTGNPIGFIDYYAYLRGLWLDNQPLTYGGDGRDPSNPVCNYMFPGTTDPLFLTNWTEVIAGNLPEDRRFIQSAGPFTLQPGEVNYISTAVVWARATSGGPLASVALLEQHDDIVQNLFASCFDIANVGIGEIEDDNIVSVFPNPANEFIIFEITDTKSPVTLKIYNTKGQVVHQAEIKTGAAYKWNRKNIAAGNYLYNIGYENKSKSGKVVLL
jgi:hypothetical protein